MLRGLVLVVALGTSSLALADTAADVTSRLDAFASKGGAQKPDVPKFAITNNVTYEAPASIDQVMLGLPEIALADKAKTTVGVSAASPAVAWISANVAEHSHCAKPGCPKQPTDLWLRATVLMEKATANAPWQPIAWALTPPIPGSEQVAAIAEGKVPMALTPNVGTAEEPAKAFTAALADPKKLSGMLSTRKDLVLNGSEMTERFVGAKAKAKPTEWDLAFVPRDGVRAGLATGGNVAWVAVNVDGKFVTNPKMKPVPYRVFAVLEKSGKDWKIVAIQFSTAV